MGILNARTVLLVFFVLSVLYSASAFFACKNLKGTFSFSSYGVSLQILDQTHKDTHIPLFATRILHNKITNSFLLGYINELTHFDTSFLLTFIGFPGLLGLVLCLLAFTRVSRSIKIVLLLLLFGSVSIDAFFQDTVPFLVRITLLLFAFTFAGACGFAHFSEKKRLLLLYLLLGVSIILTIGLKLAFPQVQLTYCYLT